MDPHRYVLIPVLATLAIVSLVKDYPFQQNWYATKILLYSGLLVIGLILRFVMRHWTETFRQLAAGGPRAELEARLDREIRMARRLTGQLRLDQPLRRHRTAAAPRICDAELCLMWCVFQRPAG